MIMPAKNKKYRAEGFSFPQSQFVVGLLLYCLLNCRSYYTILMELNKHAQSLVEIELFHT